MTYPRILIAPLDWGLGHASRCIPIIQLLLSRGAEPVIAGDGNSLALLRSEFPQLEFHRLPAYPIRYPVNRKFAYHFAKHLPSMFRFYHHERRLLHALMQRCPVDAVISDNRYGIFSSRVPCILITHQLRLPFPFSPINLLLKYMTGKFQECWIPDAPGKEALTGMLSRVPRRSKSHFKYIGWLSRFAEQPQRLTYTYRCLGIASGPEPHRQDFVRFLLRSFERIPGKHLVVTGSPEKFTDTVSLPGSMEVRGLTTSAFLQEAIAASEYVIARSGYSTIMDFTALNKTALLIPTPGQPEQEYLAKYHENRGRFVIRHNPHFDFQEALSDLKKIKQPLPATVQNKLLNEVLDDFINRLA